MPSGLDAHTHDHTHTRKGILTHEQKQFQDTRSALATGSLVTTLKLHCDIINCLKVIM